MRSFAVVAGFAAAALAAPQYEAYPAASSSAPAQYPSYPESSAPAYAASSSAPAYAASSSAPAYAASSSAPAYAASSSAPAYAASSSAPAYTTTEVISATTYECPEPTTITYGPSTYVITSSTVLSIPHYTATYIHTPTPEVPVASASKPAYTPAVPEASATKPAYTPAVPEASATKPAYSAAPPAPIYPSSNGTVPVAPIGTATGAVPSATKPVQPPQFTGAAGKATVGFFAIAGAVAAFL